MDFFEHQEVARKKTGRLVIFFLLAMGGIVAAVYFVAVAAFGFVGAADAETPATLWRRLANLHQPPASDTVQNASRSQLR